MRVAVYYQVATDLAVADGDCMAILQLMILLQVVRGSRTVRAGINKIVALFQSFFQ